MKIKNNVLLKVSDSDIILDQNVNMRVLYIPDEVKKIAPNCLDRKQIVNVVIFPDNLEKIAAGAFKNQSSLLYVYCTSPSVRIGEEAFLNTGLFEAVFTGTIYASDLAFAYCKNLTHFSIFNKYSKVEKHTFKKSKVNEIRLFDTSQKLASIISDLKNDKDVANKINGVLSIYFNRINPNAKKLRELPDFPVILNTCIDEYEKSKIGMTQTIKGFAKFVPTSLSSIEAQIKLYDKVNQLYMGEVCSNSNSTNNTANTNTSTSGNTNTPTANNNPIINNDTTPVYPTYTNYQNPKPEHLPPNKPGLRRSEGPRQPKMSAEEGYMAFIMDMSEAVDFPLEKDEPDIVARTYEEQQEAQKQRFVDKYGYNPYDDTFTP